MIQKLRNNDFFITGTVTHNATYKTVGGNDIPLCEINVFCGKKDNGEKIYICCKAWRNLAGVFSDVKEGDSFAAVGRLDSCEYNGKTYHSLNLEWGSCPMVSPDGGKSSYDLPGAESAPNFVSHGKAAEESTGGDGWGTIYETDGDESDDDLPF